MKKKSSSQSAFFNLRVLTGLFLVLTGVFLALLGFGRFSAQAQDEKEITAKSLSALIPPGFDCSSIRPRSRFGCFPADCAFPHGDCRDVAGERAFCYGTCRDVELGRPLIDIWRASPYLPALCV